MNSSFDDAVALHLAGDIPAAQDIYEKILASCTYLPTLRANLGGIYIRQGRLDEAARLLDLALSEEPYHKEALTNRAVLYEKLGDSASSLRLLELSLDHTRGTVEAYINITKQYIDSNRIEKAIFTLEKGLQNYPSNPLLLSKKASLLELSGNSDEALSFLKSNLDSCSDAPDLHYSISSIYRSRGDFESSLHHIDIAIGTAQDLPPNYIYHKASLLNDSNRKSEAIDLLNHYLSVFPQSSDLIKLKGLILHQIGQVDNAILLYKLALDVTPYDSNCLTLLAASYQSQGKYLTASECFLKSLAFDPASSQSLAGYAQSLFYMGKHVDAFNYFKKAVAVDPRSISIWDSFLYFLSFTNFVPPNEIIRLCQEYYSNSIKPTLHSTPPYENQQPRSTPTIRLGVVSSEIGSHCVSYFLLSLLRGASNNNLEIYLFPSRDRSTEPRWSEMKTLSAGFHPIFDLDDDNAAKLIRSLNLNAVLETTQHMDKNRLPLLARRVAPVQCHYIGMHGTSGIPQIDYFIGDDIITPESFSPSFTEKFLRLDRTWVCYTPPTSLPNLNATQNISNPLSFGCFNNSSKISSSTIDLWSQVLIEFPDSILYLKDSLKTTSDRQFDIQKILSANGISPDRITVVERRPSWNEHMELYNLFDVSLDTLPLSSGTTAFDSLLMGTPVMSFTSEWIGGRLSHSIVNPLLGPEWIASTPEEYIRKLRENLQNLSHFRSLLHKRRNDFLASELCDADSLASSIYNAINPLC